MATPKDTRSALSGDLNPPGGRGKLIAVGQMAMAIDHGSWQTMPTGGAASSIGGWPSGMWEQAAMGSVDGLPAVPGASGGQWSERGRKSWCAIFLSDCSSKYCIKYCELQHCAA